jgi:hypothetical protein
MKPNIPSRLFLKPAKKDLTEKNLEDLVGLSIVPRTNTLGGTRGEPPVGWRAAQQLTATTQGEGRCLQPQPSPSSHSPRTS